MKKILLMSAAFGIAAAMAGAAMAQTEADAARSVYREPVSVAVHYGDLDLSNPDGASVMLHRLHDAALNACGADDASVSDYKWSVHRSACYHQSMDRAVADLGAPAVSQLYQDHAIYASN